MADKLSIALYRGHTHGEFAMLETSQIARYVGNWCRENLADKEYVPKGWKWDPVAQTRVFNQFPKWKITKLFCGFDRTIQHLSIPAAFVDNLKAYIEDMGAEVKDLKLNDYPLRKIDIQMNPKFTDRPWQPSIIEKCSDPTPGVRCAALQTGKGKTYCATKSAVKLGYATLVVAHNLADQWIASIEEQTTAKRGDDIYKIEGFDSLAKLAKCPAFKPAFFVASTRTLQMFSNGDENYKLLPWNYSQFLKEYGIGTKIVDECHLNFHANTMMDLQSNVPYNIYCSATFTQNSKHLRKIFDKMFPPSIQYGQETFDKYVTTIFYRISGEVDGNKCKRAKGYMHVLYETQLLKSEKKLESHLHSTLVPALNQYFINRYKPGYKSLVFCSSIEYINKVVPFLQRVYNDKKVISYIGGDKRGALAEADIIVSTPGKAAVGLDIKNLITVVNTVSLASPPLSTQLFGRLRKIDDNEVIYVDFCDMNVEAHCRHAETRTDILRRLSKKFYELNELGVEYTDISCLTP